MSNFIGALILAASGLGLVAVAFRPQFAFVLVLALYPLKQLIGGYLPVFMRVSPLFNFIVFAAVVVAVGTRVLRRERVTSGLNNPLTWVTLALYAHAQLAILWTPGNGLDRAMDGYPYWLMNVALLPLALGSVGDFRKAIVPLLIVGAVIAVLFYAHPRASWYAGRFTIYIAGRGTGEEIRANPLAVGQFGGAVAVAAALLLPARAGLLMHALRGAALLGGLGLAVASGSRAQAVFAVGTMVLFYPLARPIQNFRQFALTTLGVGVLLALIWLTFDLFLGRNIEQATRWNVSDWTQQIGSRAEEAFLLWPEYATSPHMWLQGLGTNAYSAFHKDEMSYAHNAPAEMLLELGLIGLVLYAVALGLAVRAGWTLFNAYRHDALGRSTVGVLLGITFYTFVLSLKQYTFVAMPDPWWLWIVIAKLATIERRQHSAGEEWAGGAPPQDARDEWDRGAAGAATPG